jgi:glycosyltransferase involved in cell wall biosynthesis
MPQRPKILLLIPHLGGGGAERVTALLARDLSPHKYELHLGLVAQTDPGPEQFPPSVAIHTLGAPRVRAGAFRLVSLVRRLKPDLILSGIFHLNFLVLLLRPFFPHETRVLVRQNGTVSAALANGNLPVYTRLLYRLLYRRADRVICQTQAMADDLAAELGIARERLAVLKNPVDSAEIRSSIEKNPYFWTGPGPHLLAVGRLSREKGFDLLLPALLTVRQQFPCADLVIAGIGPEEPALKAECRKLGLEAAVHFAGYVDRPSAYYSDASVFVVSSRHDAMPNALLEAAAGGLPIVALPASKGIVDLLRDQPGAWLAREVSAQALAATLLTALQALQPGQRFPHPVIEEFRIERAIQAYEQLIDEALVRRQP